ncbi:hypothetical protein ACULNC_22415 [Shigella flexneri]
MIRGLFRRALTERCRVKIAILSRDGTSIRVSGCVKPLYSAVTWLKFSDPLSCYMNINPAASSIHYKGRKLPHFDAVIPRIGTAITFMGRRHCASSRRWGAIRSMSQSPLPGA